jgi:S-disulfanyl-L-cysteine oxidoreductase SoxD
MKKASLAIAIALFAPSLAQAWPWDRDMMNQISVKPQENFDEAKPGMKAFPSRSVPVPGTTVFVKDQDAASKMANPVRATAKSIDTGGRLFAIYCTPCHGKSGTGDGLVGEKLILKPFNLTSSNDQHSWTDKAYSDGYIYGMMTFGGAVMPPYANDLSSNERWHVVNYIRAVLQKSPVAAAAQTK